MTELLTAFEQHGMSGVAAALMIAIWKLYRDKADLYRQQAEKDARIFQLFERQIELLQKRGGDK